jgi:GH24 family phage-related lysozyme (muramidase)
MTWRGGFSGVGFTRPEFKQWLTGQPKPPWVKFMVAHNTAAPYIKPPITPSKRISNIGNYYKTLGWSTGPNIIVILNKVYLGTPWAFPGTNSPGYNGKGMGVEVEGDYRIGKHDPRTGDGKIAWDTASWVFYEVMSWLGLPIDSAHVKLHREDPMTTHECPGNLVTKDWLLAKIKAQAGPAVVPPVVAATPPPPTITTRKTLGKGDTGGDVFSLQRLLHNIGLYAGAIDGDFGPKTDASVRAYQALRGLVVDGVCGPLTWGKLAVAPMSGLPEHIPVPEPHELPKPGRGPVADLHMSKKGLAMLRRFEGCPTDPLTGLAVPYDDRGSLAICYGHSNRSKKPPVVTDELRVTLAECEAILANDMLDYENRVKKTVKVPLFQHEFDALVSLAYNWGPGNLDRSSLAKLINEGAYPKAAYEIRMILPNPDQKHYAGIKRRRDKEADLFSGL